MSEENINIKVKMSPKDFFLYVGAMITLYISVFSLIALLFQYINILFPDPQYVYRDIYSSGVRFQMASLIIIFPVYLFVTRLLNRDLRQNSEKKNLGIRKWLIYLTLFIAGATVLIDLVVLLNTFLGGELTTRFIFKVLVVLVVVGDVFAYYFFDLKGKWEEEPMFAKRVAWMMSLIVLISIFAGFFLVGSPKTQRLMRFDQERVGDLQNIQWQVVNYWQLKEKLPITLKDLENSISGFKAPTDPESGEDYVYSITGALTFELCATFNLENKGIDSINAPRAVKIAEPFGLEGDNWQHGEGEECFDRTIDPELYPTRIR